MLTLSNGSLKRKRVKSHLLNCVIVTIRSHVFPRPFPYFPVAEPCSTWRLSPQHPQFTDSNWHLELLEDNKTKINFSLTTRFHSKTWALREKNMFIQCLLCFLALATLKLHDSRLVWDFTCFIVRPCVQVSKLRKPVCFHDCDVMQGFYTSHWRWSITWPVTEAWTEISNQYLSIMPLVIIPQESCIHLAIERLS